MPEYHPHKELVSAIERRDLLNATKLKKSSISDWCTGGIPWRWRNLIAGMLKDRGRDDLIPFNFLGDEIE